MSLLSTLISSFSIISPFQIYPFTLLFAFSSLSLSILLIVLAFLSLVILSKLPLFTFLLLNPLSISLSLSLQLTKATVLAESFCLVDIIFFHPYLAIFLLFQPQQLEEVTPMHGHKHHLCGMLVMTSSI